MGKISISNSRYRYINEGEWPSGLVDIHHVMVRKSFGKAFFVAILVLPIACCFFYFKENSAALLLWSFLLSGLLAVLLLLWKPVNKGESLFSRFPYSSDVLLSQFQTGTMRLIVWYFVIRIYNCILLIFLLKFCVFKLSECVIIMPAFGVQLETHYSSGRIIRRFIPAAEILKPVLLECVTPVTCYWSLSLLIRGKEELMLVFKELRPPMKMLLPVWKALCGSASIDNKESPATYKEDG